MATPLGCSSLASLPSPPRQEERPELQREGQMAWLLRLLQLAGEEMAAAGQG